MSLKIKALSLMLALMLGACGSDSKDDFDGEPFVYFTVNGKRDATSVSVQRFHADPEELFGYKLCGTSTLSDGRTVTFPTPSGAEGDKFCANSRSWLPQSIVFGVQVVNNTYEDFQLSYEGAGFTISVFKYDAELDVVEDEPVWQSDYYFQTVIEQFRAAGNEVDDFVPNPDEPTVITLGPLESLPQSRSGTQVSFKVDQNYDGGADFDVANLYHWPSELNDGSAGLCDWSGEESSSSTEQDIDYNKVICSSKDLLPLPDEDIPPYIYTENGETFADSEGNMTFIARVEYNFNGGQFASPQDILITITPPDEE